MPEVQKQMEGRGASVEKMDPAEFHKYVESEIAKWTHVIKTAGITAQ
jgi:tripartite-type tricarboxylate transporter receptor subunit TctC